MLWQHLSLSQSRILKVHDTYSNLPLTHRSDISNKVELMKMMRGKSTVKSFRHYTPGQSVPKMGSQKVFKQWQNP